MIKAQLINYESMLDNPSFIFEYMSTRRVQISRQESKVQGQFIYIVKTKNILREDYVSIILRDHFDILELKDYINNSYGGFIIPVLQEKIFTKSEDLETLCEINKYLNRLIRHQIIRADRQLFSFLFVQQNKLNKKSKYQRFLEQLINLSRQYLSKMLTRQIQEQLDQYQLVLQAYKKRLQEQEQTFTQFSKLIELKNQQQKLQLNINDESTKRLNSKVTEAYYSQQIARMNQTSEDLKIIFQQIKSAFQRRLVMREHIKELKANSIRSKVNSKNESSEKVLEEIREKYYTWTKQLLRELQCNSVIIKSMINQVISVYYNFMSIFYSQ